MSPEPKVQTTGNVLIDQLRLDHQKLYAMVISLQGDVARLQNQAAAEPEEERQYGHALSWRERATAYTEDGDVFAELEPTAGGFWYLYFPGPCDAELHGEKSSAIGEAQRRYGARFLP